MENIHPETKGSLQQDFDTLNFRIDELKSKIAIETDSEEKGRMQTECGKLIIDRDLLESKLRN